MVDEKEQQCNSITRDRLWFDLSDIYIHLFIIVPSMYAQLLLNSQLSCSLIVLSDFAFRFVEVAFCMQCRCNPVQSCLYVTAKEISAHVEMIQGLHSQIILFCFAGQQTKLTGEEHNLNFKILGNSSLIKSIHAEGVKCIREWILAKVRTLTPTAYVTPTSNY